jgi:putative transposase
MMTFKEFKYRIYRNKSPEILLNKTFGCVRVVWNHQVEIFNQVDKNKIEPEQALTTTQLKRKFAWLGEVSAAALQQK